MRMRTGVALSYGLVVLRGGERYARLAVNEREEGRLLALQKLLHHDLRACDRSENWAS